MNKPITTQVGSGIVFGVLACAAILAAAIIPSLLDARRDAAIERSLADLQSAADQFFEVASGSGAAAPHMANPVAKPVLLTMSTNGNRPVDGTRSRGSVDPLTLELPNNLLPREPREVGTVVALHWSEEFVGQYGNGDGAYIEICTVEVWDVATKSRISQAGFVGGEPPEVVSVPEHQSGRRSIYGDRCDAQIIEFVENLFR